MYFEHPSVLSCSLNMKSLGYFFAFAMFLLACKPDAGEDIINQPENDLDVEIIDAPNDSTDVIGSATTLEVSDPMESISEPTVEDTLRYLALGDSYTIGESVAVNLRWPNQLADSINQNSDEWYIDEVDIIAQTGWTTANLSNAMDQQSVDGEEYDLVSLLIGVNNQYQGLSIVTYEQQLNNLLDRAIAIAGNDPNKVFVVSIPDYGYTPFGAGNQATISAELDDFNEVCLNATLAKGIRHYNITPISREWPDTPGLVASDNLHPSGLQYSLWVESFWEDLVAGE